MSRSRVSSNVSVNIGLLGASQSRPQRIGYRYLQALPARPVLRAGICGDREGCDIAHTIRFVLALYGLSEKIIVFQLFRESLQQGQGLVEGDWKRHLTEILDCSSAPGPCMRTHSDIPFQHSSSTQQRDFPRRRLAVMAVQYGAQQQSRLSRWVV